MTIHMSRRIALASLLGVAFFGASTVRADSELERALRQMNADAVRGYIQPIGDLFGANMNAGFYHSAVIPKFGLTFRFDLIMMASAVKDEQKSYNTKLPPGFVPISGSSKTATVFGGKGTLFKDAITGLEYRGSDGIINASLFPLAVPQVTVGSVYGTELSFRLIPVPSIQEFPKTTLWALGVRHSVSQYIPASPVDIAAGFFYSSLTMGDFIDFSGVSVGVQASRSFAVLDVYGGLAWEKSSMDLKYTSSDPTAPPAVNISLDGANKFRFTLGAGLNFGIFGVFADANFGSITNFSGGISFGN